MLEHPSNRDWQAWRSARFGMWASRLATKSPICGRLKALRDRCVEGRRWNLRSVEAGVLTTVTTPSANQPFVSRHPNVATAGRLLHSLGTKNKTLKDQPDGSLTIDVQADPPPGAQRSNSLPAPVDDFSLFTCLLAEGGSHRRLIGTAGLCC